MAKIGKPKKSTKGAPPPETKPSKNLTKSDPLDFITMNFKVPAEFRKEYKQLAFELEMSMVDILKESFARYKEDVK